MPAKYDRNKVCELKHVHPWFRKELEKRWPHVYIYKPPAGMYGRKGAHDFLFCIDGKFFSVELKAPKGVMTPAQKSTYKVVKEAGGFTECVAGKEDYSVFDRIESWLKG